MMQISTRPIAYASADVASPLQGMNCVFDPGWSARILPTDISTLTRVRIIPIHEIKTHLHRWPYIGTTFHRPWERSKGVTANRIDILQTFSMSFLTIAGFLKQATLIFSIGISAILTHPVFILTPCIIVYRQFP